MLDYIAAKHAQLLKNNQLDTFQKLWDYKVNWFEAPNENRGGWSGVGRVELPQSEGAITLFIKKQQNHTSRTWRHPIKGEPTFVKEFRTIGYLQARGIKVPETVFFGQRQSDAGWQAILITENLNGYQPLDEINPNEMSLQEKRILLKSVAKTVRKMHQTGVQHRALYLKHLFVKKNAGGFDVAVIDLEKARKIRLPLLQALADLITLNYRSTGWTASNRLYFFKQYLSQKRLNWLGKCLARRIMAQTAKKLRPQEKTT